MRFLRQVLRQAVFRVTGGDRLSRHGGAAAPPAPFAPLAPDRPLVVIGDVHGQLAPFARLLARIEAAHPEAEVIQLGDLIDRGEDSAGVVRLAFARRDRLRVLLGNHEEMLLRFLDAPEAGTEAAAARWLRNGGLQTLASFGLGPVPAAPDLAGWQALRGRLRAALGPGIETWLRSLPRAHRSGNVLVSHAGADPWLALAQQPAAALTWGARDFGRRRRTDGIWVVHGHVIVPEARCAEGVISVDTGAFASGRLSAAVVSAGACRFLVETA